MVRSGTAKWRAPIRGSDSGETRVIIQPRIRSVFIGDTRLPLALIWPLVLLVLLIVIGEFLVRRPFREKPKQYWMFLQYPALGLAALGIVTAVGDISGRYAERLLSEAFWRVRLMRGTLERQYTELGCSSSTSDTPYTCDWIRRIRSRLEQNYKEGNDALIRGPLDFQELAEVPLIPQLDRAKHGRCLRSFGTSGMKTLDSSTVAYCYAWFWGEGEEAIQRVRTIREDLRQLGRLKQQVSEELTIARSQAVWVVFSSWPYLLVIAIALQWTRATAEHRLEKARGGPLTNLRKGQSI